MSIREDIVESLSLAQYMLRDKENSILWAGLNTFWVPFTKITLERLVYIIMNKNSSKGTRLQTFQTGDAKVLVDLYYTVSADNRIYRTSIRAFGNSALATDNGHPHHWMRINYHNSDGRFLGIDYFKVGN
jgi:hypothetical protein